jgi:hypothetical protein
MTKWPTTCIDNFYTDPDKVREFALGLDYSPAENGFWPGKRTKELFEIDQEFMTKFCHKLMSYYFDLEATNVRWKISSQFQLIEPYDSINDSIKNTGWIHYDDALFGGLIYLNKNPNLSSGTSLYNIIDYEKYDKAQKAKHEFYLKGDYENYENLISEHNNNFIETIKFSNQYNRLIGFDSSIPHKADNFVIDNEPRLTQVFFVQDLESSRPRTSDTYNAIL